MSTSRRWVLAGARFTTGLFGIAAAVAVVGAATLLPWPSYNVTPEATVVSPDATEQQRVCPGPLLALAADANDASATSSLGRADTLYAAGVNVEDALSGNGLSSAQITVSGLSVPDNASGDAEGTPLVLSVPANDSAPLLLGGSQSQAVMSETVSGYSASACSEAVTDSWLVAGSTATGQTSLLFLSNPTAVAATVDLRIYGESGLVDAPGSTGILVQPGAQRVLAVAGLAPNLNSPVVHVSTRGGQVVASLQQSVIRGLTPGGIELVGATAAPALSHVISGYIVPPSIIDPAHSNDSDFHDDQPAIRVLNTSDTPSELTVSVTSDEGGDGTSLSVTVDAGVASEIPLTMLMAGTYTVRLSSEQPVVAAARSTEKSDVSEDFAWFVASQPIADASALVVTGGPAPTLHLVNAGTLSQTVSLVSEAGPPLTLTLPAMSSLAQPLGALQSYVLAGEQLSGVVASVSYQGSAALSSFALSAPGPLAQPLAVFTH